MFKPIDSDIKYVLQASIPVGLTKWSDTKMDKKT